ncbi:CLIP-associating protein 1 [Holothuria leucospilota]|uniref:CLIP-associating protein 1 n=1 Tax=Holothuria leucospilota TaxID=206669 RepID=A0A9Q1BZE1_HOLLE|nr:CLIP-associating protein 1 [Holothuria leucospilota]
MAEKTLDDIANEVLKNETATKFQAAKDLQEYLRNPANSLQCENFDKLVDGLAAWVNSSNFKVSLNGLECLIWLVDRTNDKFKVYISTALPPAVERLGDSKEQVRESAQNFIQKLMSSAASPQYIFERLMKAFSHKAWRVREEILLCLINTINVHGAASLTLSKVVPSICKLLGDPNSQVRDTAINTLVEIYRHVGEKVRIDLGKKGIPSSRLSIIYAKFDDVKKSGKMLVPNEQLTQRSSGGGDETDNKALLWETTVKRTTKNQLLVKPKAAKKAQARRVSGAPTQRKASASASSTTTSRPSTGSSSQALVDKETFLAAFVEVDTVSVYSAKSLQDELNSIYQTTSNEKEDWEARSNALKRLRSLVNNGAQEYECFLPLLRLMEEALILSAKDLRSQVVREACITLAHLSTKLGRQFDHAAEAVLPTLFQLIPNSAKVMSNSGCVCIEFILEHTHNPRLIPIVKSHITSKSTSIRKQTFKFILIIVSSWPPHLMEKHVGLFVEALHKGMEDADSEARSTSRKAFWKFSENFKSQADKLFNILEPSKQKMLNGELSGASSSSSLDSNRSYRKLSGSGSHENLSRMSLPKRSVTAKTRTTTELDAPVTLGKRSSSEVNLAAVDRARSRYASAATAKSPTSSKPASRLARSKSTSRDSLATPVRREPQRTPNGRSSRPKARYVSQSTPGSKSNSRSSSPSTTRLPNIVTNGSLGRSRRRSGIPVPRSQGASREASREASPSRYGQPGRERRASGGNGVPQREHLTRKQLLSQKMLSTGKDVEAALADALVAARLQGGGRFDSDDESDASSVCSAGSHGASPRIPEDMVEILAKMASPAWSERKEGLLGLQNALLAMKQLTRSEIKRVTELFTRMFVDPHSKTFSIFLETLCEFILAYSDHINDWLFILMTRLLQKMGSDLLPSLLCKIERTIDVVRENFPFESQFRILMKYIVDQTQTPNAKVKVAMLRYLETLSDLMEPSGFQNSSETRLAVSRIIAWIKEDKSMDVRRASSSVLIALFELNTSEFSAMLAFFPRSYQDTATKLLQNHLQKTSNHSELTASEVRQKASSPRSNYRSPRSHTSPRTAEPINGNGQNLDEMDSDEIIKSFRQTTAEIQSFMSSSRDDLDKLHKVSSPRLDSDQVSADSGLNTSMPDIRVDSPEGKVTEYLDFHSSAANSSHHASVFSPPQASPVSFSFPSSSSPQPHDAHNSSSSFSFQGLSEGISKLKLGETSPFEDEQFHEGEDEPTQFNALLTVLSNHSAKFEERKTAMATLIRLSHAGHLPSWEANFKTVLYLLLETLTDIEPSIRALALRVLREILRNQPERFKDYAELTILKILEAHKDVTDVARAAEETSVVLASSIPPDQSIKVLCPIIQTAEVPVNQAAIKMLTKVIEIMAYPEVKSVLSDIVPVLVKAYDNSDSSVRKASVFCLVSIHSIVGEEIKEFLDDLSGSKMKLLNLYIKRAQSEKLSQGSSPSPSSPTSLSTGSR